MKNNELNESVEQNESTQTEPTPPEVTLGHLLKSAREEMGMSVADAAVKLHLRLGIVKDLEADDFSNISSSTYIRGYVKNYARMAGIDNAAIEACLAKQVPSVTEPAMQSFSRKTTRQASDTKLTWLSVFIVVVLLGLFVWWWAQRATLVTDVDLSKPTAEELAATNQDLAGDVLLTETDVSPRLSDIAVNGSMATDGPVKEMNESDIIPSTEDAASNAATIEGNKPAEGADNREDALTTPSQSNQAVSTQAPAPTQHSNQAATTTAEPMQAATSAAAIAPANNVPAQTMPAVEGQSNINIQLTGDCWINILDANGKAIIDGVRGAGANIQASGVPPFKVILGAPTAVSSFSVDGQAISLAEYPKGRVARLTIPKA